MNARNSYTGRQTDRLYPRNDSIMPKQVGNGFMRHIILIGVSALVMFASIGISIAVLVGGLPASALWVWALVPVVIIVLFVNFALTARAMMKEF